MTTDIHENDTAVSQVGNTHQLQLILGDLANHGEALGFYNTFKRYSNNPLLITPGNHD